MINKDLSSSVNWLSPHDHVCLIYQSNEQRLCTIAQYIACGLERGEQCVYCADQSTSAQILSALQNTGLDAESIVRSGSLVIIDKNSSYLKEDRFDPDAMIEFLFDLTKRSKAAGYSMLRLTGEMTWSLGNESALARLIEYESKLNRFYKENDAIGMCQYDRCRFMPDLLASALYTHPLAVFDGRGNELILVAEDHPINQEVAKLFLESMGLECAIAANGKEVLEELARHEFALVLMDCQMPEMDGIDATAAIRQGERLTGRHLPIIAMTAHGERDKCLSSGMDDFISKPVDFEELRKLLYKWRLIAAEQTPAI